MKLVSQSACQHVVRVHARMVGGEAEALQREGFAKLVTDEAGKVPGRGIDQLRIAHPTVSENKKLTS